MAFGWQTINFDKFKPVMLAALRSLNLVIKFEVSVVLVEFFRSQQAPSNMEASARGLSLA